ISAATVAEAEKLVRVTYSAAERAQVAGNWPQAMAPVMERRSGPREVALGAEPAPPTRAGPRLPRTRTGPDGDRLRRSRPGARPRRGHRVRAGRVPLPLDRVPRPHVRTADEHLPPAAAALRRQAPLSDHPDEGSRSRAGAPRGQGDRVRRVPGPIAWDPMGC